MNWTPDKEIYYRGLNAKGNVVIGDNVLSAANAKIIVQSNYSHSYYIWGIADGTLTPAPDDVALWRLKSLKPLP